MTTARAVVSSYGLLAVYVFLLVGLTTLTIGELLPSLVQLAITVSFFVLGYFGKRPDKGETIGHQIGGVPHHHWSARTCLILGLAIVVASGIATYYYTGMAPSDVLGSLDGTRFMYSEYQVYNSALVAAGGGGALSPFFVLEIFVTASSLVVIFSVIPRGDRISSWEVFLVACVIIAQAYSGLARGTGLELFQLGTMLIFAIVRRPRKTRSALRSVLVGVLVAGITALYLRLLGVRSMGSQFITLGSDVFVQDSSSLGGLLGSTMTDTLLGLYSYFGFGFHYISNYWSEVWITDYQTIVAGLVPFGFVFSGVDPLELVPEHIDMGPRWIPDSAFVMSAVGFFGLLLGCCLLGRLSMRVDTENSLTTEVVAYFVFLQMISLPVGNFVWVDRSNLVIVGWLVSVSVFRMLGLGASSRDTYLGIEARRIRHFFEEERFE